MSYEIYTECCTEFKLKEEFTLKLVQKWKKVSSIVTLHFFYRRTSKIWLYCFRCNHNELQYLFIPDVTKQNSSPEEIYISHNYL